MKKTLIMSLLVSASVFAADYSGVIQKPNASKLIEKDLLAPAKAFT
ncbi:MAG TPA: sulfur oxidation c-type cytochrome SoxX, partial [Sulfurimonas sp.]|nr:sulfur oxidation c-type cytochrome SoxX [Sulfurimonas sp.]